MQKFKKPEAEVKWQKIVRLARSSANAKQPRVSMSLELLMSLKDTRGYSKLYHWVEHVLVATSVPL